ncbi:MAG: hypothetical protein WCB27_10085 [Thermoguttaceae bacterium]
MLRRVSTTRLAIELSLALMLGLAWTAGAKADSPAKGSEATAGRAATALKKAAKHDKYLFVFFFQDGEDMQTRTMYGVFQKALEKMKDRADGLGVNVMDPAEKPIVEQFRARGAPMPMVLAIAPTGAATKAFTKQFDAAQLQEAFVSPCTAKCMRAIQDRQSILLCVQNDKTKENKEALDGAKEFQNDPKYNKGIVIIILNPADKAEQRFLKDLEVDPRTPTAVTLLVTPPGAPVAHFTGAVTKEAIETAVTAAQSSCGPGCSCHH